MTPRLRIGNLFLDMGSLGHVLGLPKTRHDYEKYLQYAAYQAVVTKSEVY